MIDEKKIFGLAMNSEPKFVLGIVFLCMILSSANFLYYRDSLSAHLHYLTDYHSSLLGLRLFVTFLLFVVFIGIWMRRFLWKILALSALVGIVAFYVSWYFDKFKWLNVSGVYEGTPQYTERLKEIGYFRGANDIDYLIFFLAIIFFFWTLLRYDAMASESV